jgi:arylformamidase
MREIEFITDGRRWRADLAAPADLAIPLDFDGPQPRFFAAEPARATPLRAGGFTGEVRRGASCNCGVYALAPHCHGTHTESVAHVTIDGPTVAALTPVPASLALLVSVHPVHAGGERTITRAVLDEAAARWRDEPWTALVVRTLPNDPSRRHHAYSGPNPAPYFGVDAMQWIVGRGVDSLVVDLPSLDRADDGGALAAHRAYWGLPAAATDPRLAQRPRALVTELAWIPDTVADGLYLLELQVPAFGADAAPSRPLLYRVTEVAP